ncbi:MAG: RNB domain-containing ribonuclease [Opitutales bacterium]|nr:RNB domain-containing ribonuclease [Opitutales bacterium]
MHYLPQLLGLLKRRDYVPLPAERLAEKLDIAAGEREDFRAEIERHLKQGTLVRLKKNRLCLPRDADLVTGRVRFRQSGAAILLPDAAPDEKPPAPLQVRAEDTWVAMHGDHVVCRIIPKRKLERYRRRKGPLGDDAESARVIRILERKRTVLAGTLKRSKMFHFVIPDDPRIIQDILVPEPEKSRLSPKPKIDDKVVVKLFDWEQRHLNPEGEIIEVLGKTHTPGAEYHAILRQYDLDPEFPAEVVEEVAELPARVPKSDLKGRVDLRRTHVFTIDPQDAKDFDDALSIEPLEDGGHRVGVHIADVSAYVSPGTALDAEARERGNSTYLVGTVIPMLPHALSNGLCSLVEGEDRLTKSVFIHFTKNGKIEKTEFADSVIRSAKRLTYEQAYALMKENDFAKIRALPTPPKHQTGATGRPLGSLSNEELGKLQTAIRGLWDIGSRLRKRRMRSGSLDLDMPETKIYVDEQGYADRIVLVEHDESHQLVEEFMLAANEAVAKALNHRRIPAIHRVHDKPETEKLEDLSTYMKTVGIDAGDLTTKKNILSLLAKIRKHPQAHMLRIQLLRSLKQAGYRASPDGHYGLGKQHYTHFTSPIRRYSDLVVHRIFARNLSGDGRKEKGGGDNERYTLAKLSPLAQHLSLTEQNSTEAERESNKVKLLEFFEREAAKEKKSVFDAVILEIKNHGMFVELTESLAYGLVHASTLTDDLYQVTDDNAAFRGRRTRKTYGAGETVQVVVHRVDRFKRQVDFALAEFERSAAEKAAKAEAKGKGPATGGHPKKSAENKARKASGDRKGRSGGQRGRSGNHGKKSGDPIGNDRARNAGDGSQKVSGAQKASGGGRRKGRSSGRQRKRSG